MPYPSALSLLLADHLPDVLARESPDERNDLVTCVLPYVVVAFKVYFLSLSSSFLQVSYPLVPFLFRPRSSIRSTPSGRVGTQRSGLVANCARRIPRPSSSRRYHRRGVPFWPPDTFPHPTHHRRRQAPLLLSPRVDPPRHRRQPSRRSANCSCARPQLGPDSS